MTGCVDASSSLLSSNESLESSVVSSEGSSSSENSSAESTSSSLSSSSASSSTSSSASSVSSSSTSESSSSSENPVTHLGNKTAAEIRELCTQYVTNLNTSNIGIDYTHTVTLSGLALARHDLVKTKKDFGLNISGPGKVLMGDSTGMIACASSVTSDGLSFYGKVSSYAGEPQSKYEVTGYLSIYLGQPELYVADRSFYGNYNPDLPVNCDVSTISKGDLTLDQFYEKVKQTNYNCAGHGYGDIYTVKSVKCIEKRDTNVFICTDGSQLIKVIKNKTSISVGGTYDIVGYLSTESWKPAIQALKVVTSSAKVNDLTQTCAQDIDLDVFRKYDASQEDTSKRFDSYMDTFRYVYKSRVYANYYSVSGKYYVTIAKNYTDRVDITQEAAYLNLGMVAIANNNYWNVSATQLETYCKIYGPYVQEEVSFDCYYSAYYQEYKSKKPCWKVFIYEDLLDPIEQL